MPAKLLFLPGASGKTDFWVPVANLLKLQADHVYLEWPGFGSITPDPHINSMDDLVERVVAEIDRPCALIAQSMGCIMAIRATLEQPGFVTHLVLAVTSGGMDLQRFGALNWRPLMYAANPSFPRWFADYNEDLSCLLPKIQAPTLLLWGDADPISPVGVGREIASLLPNAKLHIVSGGDHNLAMAHAKEVAPLIDAHLANAV